MAHEARKRAACYDLTVKTVMSAGGGRSWTVKSLKMQPGMAGYPNQMVRDVLDRLCAKGRLKRVTSGNMTFYRVAEAASVEP